MKTNKFARLAAMMLIAVMVTCTVVGGTFAKYTTTMTNTDSARIAHWGFNGESTTIGLFSDTYSADAADATSANTVDSFNGDKVIAPGTTKEAKIHFVYNGGSLGASAPEVSYNLKMSAELTPHDVLTESAERLNWYVKYIENGEEKRADFATQEELLKGIAGLIATDAEITYTPHSDGATGINVYGGKVEATHQYSPGELPLWLANGGELTIGWEWDFEDTEYDDFADSILGNWSLFSEDEYVAKDMTFTISLTATQID